MAPNTPASFLPSPGLLTTRHRLARQTQICRIAPRRPLPNMAVQHVHIVADLPLIPSQPPSRVATLRASGRPLLVFIFVTEGCRACRYAQTGFNRLAEDFEGLSQPRREVQFYEVNVSSGNMQQLGQYLGVQAVPKFQIYAYKAADVEAGWPGGFGIIEELMGPRVIAKLRDSLLHRSSHQFDLQNYVLADDS